MRISSLSFLSAVLIWGCTAPSYLDGREPGELVLRKRVYGGVAALAGTELASPSFNLYANGTVITYGSVEGKRRMVVSRLRKDQFFTLIHRAEQLNLRPTPFRENLSSTLPITELFFDSIQVVLPGLGFMDAGPDAALIDKFVKDLDRLPVGSTKPLLADSVVVYVKKVSKGDVKAWPPWPLQEINPISVYRQEISFYESNVEANSVVVYGKTAKRVQQLLQQTGIYEKFTFNGSIFAVGYRPLLP